MCVVRESRYVPSQQVIPFVGVAPGVAHAIGNWVPVVISVEADELGERARRL